MKGKIIIASILLIFICLNVVSAQENQTETISVDVDDSTRVTSDITRSNEEILTSGEGNFTELQRLIDETPSGGELKLEKNYTHFTGESGNLTIFKRITINGNGYTINGDGHNCFIANQLRTQIRPNYYQISYFDISFKNITFLNCNKLFDFKGGNVNVDYCSFNNTASLRYTGSYKLTMNYCNFINILGRGDIMYLSAYSSTLNNCIFQKNSQRCISVYSGTTNINNCQFINNTGVSVYNSRGKLYIYNSSFIDNKVVPVSSGNYATVLTTVTDSKFYRNPGAITATPINVKNCEFINNTGYRGAVITLNKQTYYYEVISNPDSTIENSIFINDVKDIQCDLKDEYLILKNNNFTHANSLGEIIYAINLKLTGNKLSNKDDYIHLMNNTDRLNLRFLDNKTVAFKSSAYINVDAFDDNNNTVLIHSVFVNVNDEYSVTHSLKDGKFFFMADHPGKYVFSGSYTPTASGDVEIGIADFEKAGYRGPFYVSNDGSDEDEGSQYEPFKTIEHAMDMISRVGTVPEIIIYSGNYTGNSFSISRNLKISGLGDVVINGEGKQFLNMNGYNITLSNLEFVNFKNFLVNSNVTVDKCVFENNTGKSLFEKYKMISFNNTVFRKNSAENIVLGNFPLEFYHYPYMEYDNEVIAIINCDFIENENCIYECFANITVEDSRFIKNKGFSISAFGFLGHYTYSPKSYVTINDSLFHDNQDITVIAPYITVHDSNFTDNKNGALSCDVGPNGVIFYPGDGIIGLDFQNMYTRHQFRNATVVNCNFINNNASLGGAISSVFDVYAINSKFINNSAEQGGAIYAPGRVGITDCEFIGNNATYGGAIFNENYQYVKPAYPYDYYYYGGDKELIDSVLKFRDIKVDNTLFKDNNALVSGGAITCMGGEISETIFTGNNAATGGAVYVDEYFYVHNNVSSNKILKIRDSEFIKNAALYGGGAVASVQNNTLIIANNKFNDNVAGYGGALSVENAVISENTFTNNQANLAASIFTLYSNLYGNEFKDNRAKFGNIVYVEDVIFSNTKPDLLGAAPVNNDVLSLFELVEKAEAFIDGYCVEMNNDKYENDFEFTGLPEPVIYTPFYRYNQYGPLDSMNNYYLKDLFLVQNTISREDVSGYVKILIAYYHEEENLNELIWEFTDKDYMNSDNPIVQDVISKYNQGVSGDYVVLENGTVKVFNYTTLLTLSQKQNKLSYAYELIDAGINKTANNDVVGFGDEVSFNITVSNRNDYALTNISIVESYDSGLVFIGHESSRSWRSDDNKTWYLIDDLKAGENVTIFFKFKANKAGILENNVTLYCNDYKLGNSSDNVEVIKPDINVVKISLNRTVNIGELTLFEIIVTNTGNVDLESVYVIEDEYGSGLIYNGFKNGTGNWTHSLTDSKHTYYLDHVLGVGESASLIVSFNTTKVGNFTNTVVAGFSNDTVNATNTTEVVNNTNNTDVFNSTDNETDIPEPETPGEGLIVYTPTDEDSGQATSSIYEEKHPESSKSIDSKATGNPLAILIVCLILIGQALIRRKDEK